VSVPTKTHPTKGQTKQKRSKSSVPWREVFKEEIAKQKEFVYKNVTSIKTVLTSREDKFVSIKERLLKKLKLNDAQALCERFKALYDHEHTDIIFHVKAKNEEWDENYVFQTLCLWSCLDYEIFELSLDDLEALDENQRTVLALRIVMRQPWMVKDWNCAPKKGTIGDLLASSPYTFCIDNLLAWRKRS